MDDDFKRHFRENYGRYHTNAPDYSRCAASVPDAGSSFGSHQCRRKNGHGPDGAWCKTHDPVACAEREKAKHEDWRRRHERQCREFAFREDCIRAITEIADGHNDPRGLAMGIIARRNGAGA